MANDWLLVETLGGEPVVVAQDRQLKNLVPLTQFLRRSPHHAAIRTAIAESVRTGQSLASITPRSDRVIRTEPVVMSDGRVHGVHVWTGRADTEPPERPIPGPLKWDLTLGVATDTVESLINSGKNPEVEATHGRAFAEQLPTREFSPNENKVLALAIRAEAGQTICSSWDVTDFTGENIRMGFVVRTAHEVGPGGREHLVTRGMNWRCQFDGAVHRPDYLAQQILRALAQPGAYRAMGDLSNRRMLKWLDGPCPFYDWRSPEASRIHPDDQERATRMEADMARLRAPASGVLRLRQQDGGWAPVHVTVTQVELDEGTMAGLVALRLPNDAELADAGLSAAAETS